MDVWSFTRAWLNSVFGFFRLPVGVLPGLQVWHLFAFAVLLCLAVGFIKSFYSRG